MKTIYYIFTLVLDLSKFFKFIEFFLFFALLFFVSPRAYSNVLGLMNDVQGIVFLNHKGKVVEAKKGTKIHTGDEIMTEVGALATFQDFKNKRFHISGQTHIKVDDQNVDLKSGYLWIQSLQTGEDIATVRTANAYGEYKGLAECVITYDKTINKTQVVSLKGKFSLSHPIDLAIKEDIIAGQFSYISKNYEDGRPRVATAIGQNSFQRILTVFRGIKQEDVQDIQNAMKTNEMNSKSNDYKNLLVKSLSEISTNNGVVVEMSSSYSDHNEQKATRSIASVYEYDSSNLDQSLDKIKKIPTPKFVPLKLDPSRLRSGVPMNLYGEKNHNPLRNPSSLPAGNSYPKINSGSSNIKNSKNYKNMDNSKVAPWKWNQSAVKNKLNRFPASVEPDEKLNINSLNLEKKNQQEVHRLMKELKSLKTE